MIGIANVHHYLRARPLFLSDHAAIDGKINEAFVDAAQPSFGAADSYFHSGLQNVRRVAGADDAGQSQLATDDGAVTGATAAIGDYRRGLFHDRLPRRICHRSYQHVAGFEFSEMIGMLEDMNATLSDLFADRNSRDQ